MKRIILFISVFLFSASVFAHVQTMLDTAKNYYTQGDFYEAQLIYQQLVDEDYNSYELFYNLGNCYFRGEQFAQAIYYYEKALQLKPNDENTQVNLRIANSRIPDKLNVLEPVFYAKWYNSVLKNFSANAWAIWFLILVVLAFVCGIIYLFSSARSIKKLGFISAIVLLVFAFISIHFSVKQRNNTKFSNHAIVFEDLMVKSSPGEDGNNLFEIHKGLKVSVGDTLSNWSEIRLPDGKTGWALSEGLKKL
ncbi:MAG: tetratricopeptide repeat protein [Bacteroidales bacterium]|nr:tetratricopeptide repeat protein [Bacteroidales bacterium]